MGATQTPAPVYFITMNQPSQASVAQRAYKIWQDYGSPDGRDTEIWLEAERQLQAEAEGQGANAGNGEGQRRSQPSFAERVKGETAAQSAAEFNLTP